MEKWNKHFKKCVLYEVCMCGKKEMEVGIKNINSPFTELFSILKRQQTYFLQTSDHIFNVAELRILHQHAENAIDMMLQGLQDIGQLIGIFGGNKNFTEFFNIGFFISGISNLAEALNSLKQDVDFLLKMHM